MKHFKSLKTYRYKFILKKNSLNKKKLLVCLHGYGQLIQYFSKKFETLNNKYSLLFPEGPHRFYLKGSTGRVGASWMTREDRMFDINDNMFWLSELIYEVKNQYKFHQIYLLGFSQGGATAIRLHNEFPSLFDKLIIWGSDFPPEVDKIRKEEFNGSFVVGLNDPYFKKNVRQIIEIYQEKKFNIITYDGGHDIDLKCLEKIFLTNLNPF